MKRYLCGWLVLCALLIVPILAQAHGRSTSYITWTLQESIATVRVKMALIDQSAVAAKWSAAKPQLNAETVLPEQILLFTATKPCSPVIRSFHELSAEHGSVVYEWQTKCTGTDGAGPVITKLRSDFLFDVITAHVALIRFHDPKGDREFDYVLTDSRREVVLPSQTAPPTTSHLSMIARFGRAGIEHLLTGWDHLAFLLALVVASRSIRSALICLTGFTLGHSLTLSMAVLGHAAAKPTTVEVLIAISIVLVSTENVWLAENRSNVRLPLTCVLGLLVLLGLSAWQGAVSPLAITGMALFEVCYLGLLLRSEDPDKLRWLCAGLFGLLHGFGFAGSLSQLDLPAGSRVVPLASFNIGLEFAQIFIACLAWPMFVWLRKRHSETRVTIWGSALTMAVGSYACFIRIWV